MKCTVLIENQPGRDRAGKELAGEHGLALWIEYGGRHYLLDTGSTDAFLSNADVLGIDLNQAEAGILSHAHFDHSGGFAGFFSRNDHAPVYLQAAAKEACYSLYHDKKRYLGIPEGVLETYADRFLYVDGRKELAPGLFLLPHTTAELYKRGERAFMYRETEDGRLLADDFRHEQSLAAETQKGLVVINSCSHGGIENIVREVKEALPGKQVYAVVGGFHLMTPKGITTMAVDEAEVLQLLNDLEDLGVQEIYTGHCTGEPAFAIMERAWPGRVHSLKTGTVIEFI